MAYVKSRIVAQEPLSMVSFVSHSRPSNLGKLMIIGGFCLVAYMLYALTVSVYKSYQIDKHIQEYEAFNRELEKENLQKLADFQYYTSDFYREKIAKQSLGLMNSGEKVIVITSTNDDISPSNKDNIDVNMSVYERYNDFPSYIKWWKFFFEDNQFRP